MRYALSGVREAPSVRDMPHNRKSGMPRDMFEAQNAPQTSKIKRRTEPYFDSIPLNASFGTFGLQKYTLVLPYLTSGLQKYIFVFPYLTFMLFCLFAGSENGRGDRGAEAAVI